MSCVRWALPMLLLVVVACGEEEPVVERGAPRLQFKNGRPEAPQRVDAPQKQSTDASAAADAQPDAGFEEEPDPPPAVQPEGLIEALGLLAKARRAVTDERQPDAVKALKRATELYADEGWLHVELARACLRTDDHACASAAAQAAIDHSGGVAALEAVAQMLLGRALQKAGNNEGAREAFQRSVKISPSAAVVQSLRQLSTRDGGQPAAPERVVCPQPPAEGDAWVAAVSSRSDARDSSICPVLETPFSEPDPGGTAELSVLALLKPHRGARDILDDQGGLAAEGASPLLLVRRNAAGTEVVELTGARDETRRDEILSEVSASIQTVTLGPSRPGLSVVVTTRGWWNVNRGSTPYAFERSELFIVGRHLNRLSTLARQVTSESGHEAAEDCLFGSISRPIQRAGTVWLEDLDQSGVPEICHETIEQGTGLPEWLGEPGSRRLDAICHQWVASELQRSSYPVPSLELDQLERERAVGEVLDRSRVPIAIRAKLSDGVRPNEVVLVSKSLDPSVSGLHALAVVASDTSVKVVTANSNDSTTTLDLGAVGRWQDLWATIDSGNSKLLQVRVTARGNLDGAAERSWLHLITAGPGAQPALGLSVETRAVERADTDPCPSVTARRGTPVRRGSDVNLILAGSTRRWFGSVAQARARRELCQFVQGLTTALDAGPASAADLPEVAGAICEFSREQLPNIRYTQNADGRFAQTTLP